MRRGIVLRAIDKIDRLGVEGVSALLGEGRKDESGDFTKGAGLSPDQAHRILAFVAPDAADEDAHLRQIGTLVGSSAVGAAGLNELEQIVRLLQACGYGPDRVMFDTGVVRGLDYYTGAVFEAQLTFPIQNEDGEKRWCSVRWRAAGAMTIWWRASPASRCRPPAFPSACRA